MLKLILCIIPILLLVSCQVDPLEQLDLALIPALENVKIKNGRLHFPSQEEYNEVDLAINSKTPLDLRDWQDKIGFISMKKLDNEMQKTFSSVQTMSDYRIFLNSYQEHLHITVDSSISMNGYQPFFSQVLNVNGEVYIGNTLIKYTNTHCIKIADGSESKLEEALRRLETDETKGIYVESYQNAFNTTLNARSCAPREVWHTCFSGWWHRSVGYYQIDNNYGTVSSATLANNSLYDLSTYLRVNILTQYKGFLGFWYRERTTITWDIGWGASTVDNGSPDMLGGTGWTVSDVSEINYSAPIRSLANSVRRVS